MLVRYGALNAHTDGREGTWGRGCKAGERKRGGNTTAISMQAVQETLKRKKKINTSWDKKKKKS